MIKKMSLKKILICIISLFAIFLIYIIPDNEEIKINEELVYIDENINTSTIFLLNSNNLLGMTKIITNGKTIEQKATELIKALTIDSEMQDNIPNGFKALIPPNTKINSIKYENNLLKIDFSKEFLEIQKENEIKVIEAIIYTLTNIDEVDNIIIYVDGKILTHLAKSNITLPSTLNRSFGINKEYDITSNKDITKTTIYYVSLNNNDVYYVPVTKINNDNRKKIEIIIDELSSNNVYKNNLMSYLNSNTEIISVNENENEFSINFNNNILADLNSNEILEEVIYTISLSIEDNYNVNSIVFNVENEEIYKKVIKTIE